MKLHRHKRSICLATVLTAVLTAALALGACAAPEADGQSRAARTALSDSESRTPSPYQPEAPSAYDLSALTRPSSTQGEQASLSIFGASPSLRLAPVEGEVRSVWISYLELNSLLTGKTQAQFTAGIGKVFDDCRSYGLNTVIVHVRPFADALYRSDYFPWSYLCTGTEGSDPGFDPLEIMVEEAHARNLRIEAWVNPYRIRAAYNSNALSAENQAKKWLDAGDEAVISYSGVVSYNPASKKAQALIVNGVREIVRRYGVDGIHIDDYFYPATATGAVDTGFDAASYRAYRNAGGQLSQADWRRWNVEALLAAMYAGIKAEDPNVLFGISPQSSVYNNYNAMFLDVEKIVSNPGYCDYVCPQIYFGFQNGAQPFRETLESWDRMVTCPEVGLYVGLAAYKAGVQDSWAGNGKLEWTQSSDLLRRMVESARLQSASSRLQSSYKGFVLYRYDSLFRPEQAVAAHVQKEAASLREILR